MATLLIDWGIGGLSVYKALRQYSFPSNIIYISDSGSIPYGKQTEADLTGRLQELITFAQHQFKINRCVLACNAASTVLDKIQTSVPIFGIIEAGVELLEEQGGAYPAYIGGDRTVHSGLFESALKPKVVLSRSGQPLSALVESGKVAGPEPAEAVARAVVGLEKATALLLACTHYPALIDLFQTSLPQTKILDPAHHLATQLNKSLSPLNSFFQPNDLFFTSGSAVDMEYSARAAFSVSLKASALPEKVGN